MFTGIVDHCGEIIEAKIGAHSAEFKIRCQFHDIKEGESISVNGICLTAVSVETGVFSVQISPETFGVTAINQCKVGDQVNLERSLAAGDRMGGHLVTGHVDGTATIKKITHLDNFVAMLIGDIAEDDMQYLIHKGSVAINGVSLTVNKVLDDGFELMLIPHTLEITNLSDLKEGHTINIEFDMLMKKDQRQFATQMEIA